jgi:hypothetical protein
VNARHVASAALVTTVLLMGGCSVTPEPEETAHAFATEEEAFAAAEQTYRAYVDALNQVDLSDPETFEPVFALTTGEANASARQTFSQMHADGLTVSGQTSFDNFNPMQYRNEGTMTLVESALCLDVAEVIVLDKAGNSVVPGERLDRQPVEVVFASLGGGALAIESSNSSPVDVCVR